MKKVGILYDNISGNTGDVAIGLSLKQILRQLNVPFDELVPGNFNPLEYDTIIIGGGHLLRTSPDFFYDKFRIPGNHILNAVGILGNPQDLDYLNNYQYVSVRSNGDKKKLAYLNKEVNVVPCTTMLLEDLKDFSCNLKKPCIGIHILPLFASQHEEDAFIRWASSLPFTIYFIPITHYCRDIDFMRRLQVKIPNAELLPILKVEEIFTLIGKFDFFISCSLHGAIFAYVHNVPFLVHNYSDKMQFFMEDRHLNTFLFRSFPAMKVTFAQLQAERPDYSQKILEDKKNLNEYIRYLKTILPTGTSDIVEDRDRVAQSNYQIQFLLQGTSRLERNNADLARYTHSLEKKISDRDHQIRSLQQENNTLMQSIAYKVTTGIHRIVIERLFRPNTRRRRHYDLGLQGGRILVGQGPGVFLKKARDKFFPGQVGDEKNRNYAHWIKINESKYKNTETIRTEITSFAFLPTISIVVPVWETDKQWLSRMVDSVLNQMYPHWELCIVDAGSKKAHVKEVLVYYQDKDPRIKVKFLDDNFGISDNTNEAVALASGDYIGFLDHDDELAPFALYEVVQYINNHRSVKLLYSDEDKLYENNIRADPFFKPDWAPDHFLSQNYICHFLVIEKDVLARTGKLRKEFDGSQDYDLILRVTELINASEIGHIQKILYHWRVLPSSTSYSIQAKPSALVSSKNAIQEALTRRKIEAEVENGIIQDTYRVKYTVRGKPLISIIIPTNDHAEDLGNCIQSIFLKTTYDNYEIIIVDNNSHEPETFSLFTELKNDCRIRIIEYPHEFNFSGINNYAVGFANGELLLFLNNDTEVINQEWLSTMLEHAQRQEVGAVGAKLLYRDGTIQHAGVILGIGDTSTAVAGHSHKYACAGSPGYFSSLNVIRNYSAVTAACLMTRKKVFEEVGGFNEILGVAFNDVDFCLKIRSREYLIVYTPYAELFHTESKSRGYDDTPEKARRTQSEVRYIRSQWGMEIDKGDPYYNRNLSHIKENFSLNFQE